jgi:hypothetical protein
MEFSLLENKSEESTILTPETRASTEAARLDL